MALTCACPAATALPDVGNVSCAEGLGQIQKIAFQRLKEADGTKNSFTTGTTTAIEKKAAWETFLSAADGTKIVVTPFIESPSEDGGDERTSGGGNDSLGGIERNIGRNPVTFSGVFNDVPQSIIKQLKQLQCEAAANNLGIYLFDENGHIEAMQDATTATTFYPIPIRNLFIGDKKHGNLEAPDSNAISFAYVPNASDSFKIVVPEFNPLTDIEND